LYDKRLEKCYARIKIVRYTSVSSTLSVHSGYNILLSQLHRYGELITVKRDYVLQVSKLLLRMQSRGYRISILYRKLKHHLHRDYMLFGDVHWRVLCRDVVLCVKFWRSQPNWEAWHPAAWHDADFGAWIPYDRLRARLPDTPWHF
jgi:hypothetical protein